MPENEVIAFVAFFMTLGAVGVTLIVTRYLARRLRSQEILRALEKGQELPLDRPAVRHFVNDLRTGVLLIMFALGMGLFILVSTSDEETAALAYVPLFLGVGFLVNAALVNRFGAPPDDAAAPAPASVPDDEDPR